jgi:multidrug resistance efflux pump
MKQLFPPEIIHDSAEKYFNQQHTASRAVYLILLSALITLIILLPVIKVDITTQGGGVIRSRFDDNIIQSAVYGEVVRADLSENLTVKQGDTLIVISTRKTDSEISYYKLQVKEETIHMKDLVILLTSDNTPVSSTLFRQEFIGFRGTLEEQKVKMSQVNKEFILAETLYDKKVIPKTEY